MTIDRNSLFQLTPDEFEKLCTEILKALGFKRVELVGGYNDQGVDIIAEAEGQQIAVQVKHTKQLSISTIRRIISQIQVSTFKPKQIIIMSSAILSHSLKDSIQDLQKDFNLKLIDQNEILKVLNAHPEIQHLQVIPAQRRTIRQRWEMILGSTMSFISIIGILFSGIFYFVQPEKPQLQERIETVESAIGNLKDLEKQLVEIKGDMVETEKASKVIEEEYAKAKELEKLTHEQLEAVKSALRSQSWQKTALNYLLGFILGVASSLIASVIYSRIRQNRALLADNNIE